MKVSLRAAGVPFAFLLAAAPFPFVRFQGLAASRQPLPYVPGAQASPPAASGQLPQAPVPLTDPTAPAVPSTPPQAGS
ncbi:MAG: hypothetical protein ACYCO3_10840, partial [Mycobacteriales bacterium]